MKKNLSKEQLFEHFAGKSSLLLKREIEVWLQNPINEDRYYAWLEDWERQHTFWKPDTEADYEALRNRITNEEPEATKIDSWVWWRSRWVMGVAASVVLVVASVVFRDNIIYKNYRTEFGAMQQLKLDDGTAVTLNSNSTLRVPRFGFGTDTREVQLEGEAYFSVTHTPTDQKFVVKTNRDFSIEVLGTEFTVRKRQHGMQVVLDKGSVKVHYGQEKRDIMMKPGDLVTLNQAGLAKIEQTAQPQKYSAWRSHKFIFDKTPLREITNLLQENFGLTTIITSTELAQRSISGEIEAKTADELLEALSEILNLKIERKDQQIIFRELDN